MPFMSRATHTLQWPVQRVPTRRREGNPLKPARVGGSSSQSPAVTDATRSVKSSDPQGLRRLIVPKARGLASQGAREAAQRSVKIRHRLVFTSAQANKI